jgi:hypothetical protein
VPARLEAHEPVADPRERGEHHAVGELDVPDAEWVCQRSLHAPIVAVFGLLPGGYFFFRFFFFFFFFLTTHWLPF